MKNIVLIAGLLVSSHVFAFSASSFKNLKTPSLGLYKAETEIRFNSNAPIIDVAEFCHTGKESLVEGNCTVEILVDTATKGSFQSKCSIDGIQSEHHNELFWEGNTYNSLGVVKSQGNIMNVKTKLHYIGACK